MPARRISVGRVTPAGENCRRSAEQVDQDTCSDVRLVAVQSVVEHVDLVVVENIDIDVVHCCGDRGSDETASACIGRGARRDGVELSIAQFDRNIEFRNHSVLLGSRLTTEEA